MRGCMQASIIRLAISPSQKQKLWVSTIRTELLRTCDISTWPIKLYLASTARLLRIRVSYNHAKCEMKLQWGMWVTQNMLLFKRAYVLCTYAISIVERIHRKRSKIRFMSLQALMRGLLVPLTSFLELVQLSTLCWQPLVLLLWSKNVKYLIKWRRIKVTQRFLCEVFFSQTTLIRRRK